MATLNPSARSQPTFGSFFNEVSVQQMITDPHWTDPEVPASVSSRISEEDGKPDIFGVSARELFFIDFEAFTFVNHGAFGGALRRCYREARAWQDHCESQPLRFLDRELFPHMVRLLRSMAAFVNCDARDLAFMPNATTALSTVLANVALAPRDEVLMLDIGYGAVKKMAARACERSGARCVQARVALPVTGPEAVEEVLLRHVTPATKLLVLDFVTSSSAICLPVTRLVAACRAKNERLLVLIDGAHALGQLPVDLEALGVDFFVANCHKWLCAPRGSAILWVKRQQQAGLKPLVVSHGYGHGFTSDFIWDGCRDYSAYLGVEAALRWWRTNGPERVRAHICTLLATATRHLVAVWRSDALAPLSMLAAMACVRLPAALQSQSEAPSTDVEAKALQEELYRRKVEVPVKCLGGVLYVRISAHVYNCLGDYVHLGQVVLGLC